MAVFDFDPPERFVAGTVGPPGQRVFFLQATQGSRVVAVALEKEQVRLLGEGVAELLDQVAGEDGSAQAGARVVDNAPLDTPIEEDFRVRRLSLSWDAGRRVVLIEAADTEGPDDEDEQDVEAAVARTEGQLPPQDLRVALGPAQARAFAQRCARAVAGGRPSCPFCGGPLDPTGHVCPRANGYRR